MPDNRSTHCPACGRGLFQVAVTVQQTWQLDENGNFVMPSTLFDRVVEIPDRDDTPCVCTSCGHRFTMGEGRHARRSVGVLGGVNMPKTEADLQSTFARILAASEAGPECPDY